MRAVHLPIRLCVLGWLLGNLTAGCATLSCSEPKNIAAPSSGGAPNVDTVPPEPVRSAHGLRADYFPQMRLPASSRVDPVVDFDWGAKPPVDGWPLEFYAARWTGVILPRFSET